MRVHFRGGQRKDTWVFLDEVLRDGTFKVVPLNEQLQHQKQKGVKEKPLTNCWAMVVIIYLLEALQVGLRYKGLTETNQAAKIFRPRYKNS